jgi:hypothetical protein
MADIQAANNMAGDETSLQAEQVLEIPQYTPTPEATQEVVVAGEASSQPLYREPTLLYPPEGETFQGEEARVILQWMSVGILENNEYYEVRLQIPTPDGTETYKQYARNTAWRIPEELFPAPTVEERGCTWQIAVVRDIGNAQNPRYVAIGETSPRREFFWNPASP